jgi:putative ABC transport system ATP-binding protein
MNAGVRVELAGVTRDYATAAGVVRAVDGIDLDVPAGTSLAIRGPSGCGKSTLLGLIGGLDAPTAGSVTIDGREISALSERDRSLIRRHEIGLVFQSDNLLPFLTATENVGLQLALDDADERSERILRLLTALGLAEEASKFPDQLSGGQRQRVAVARAVVHRPRLIVADEPTGSLDAVSARAVVDLLLAAQRDAGATLLLVTHESGVASRLARTVNMLDGRLVDRPSDAGRRAASRSRA